MKLDFIHVEVKISLGYSGVCAIHSLKLQRPSKPFGVKGPKSVSFFSKMFTWQHQVSGIALRIFYLQLRHTGSSAAACELSPAAV